MRQWEFELVRLLQWRRGSLSGPSCPLYLLETGLLIAGPCGPGTAVPSPRWSCPLQPEHLGLAFSLSEATQTPLSCSMGASFKGERQQEPGGRAPCQPRAPSRGECGAGEGVCP